MSTATADCSGMTYAEIQVALLLEDEDVPGEEALQGLGSLLTKGLVRECNEHPKHYIITPEGLLAMWAAIDPEEATA